MCGANFGDENMKKVTVVIEYNEDNYPEGVSFGYGMLTEDLPEGNITAVYFGDAINEEECTR